MPLVPVDQRLRLTHDRDVFQRNGGAGHARIAEVSEARKRTFMRRIGCGGDVDREQRVLALKP